jgi:3-phenylpropionate/trans-cinnamate dioxygenase ferredoxin subunit
VAERRIMEPWQAELCTPSELPALGEAARFEVSDRTIAVFNVDGIYYAVDDTCTHRPASLSLDGSLDGTTVVCGWHHSMFDLATGANVGPPACDDLRSYNLEVSDVVLATERQPEERVTITSPGHR